jgi:hypothetical protein
MSHRETPKCRAALNIKGQHYPCDWDTNDEGKHPGWAHSNVDARAIWIGDEPDPSEHWKGTGL